MSDTITVDGATYYRAGSGWRLSGARDVAVGPRFCALLDEIARLRAEREQAEAAVAAEKLRCTETMARIIDATGVDVGAGGITALAAVRQLRAERDAARKDAERWRFLRLRVGMYDHAAQMVGFVFPWKSLTIGDPDSLDAAIDAARAAEGGTTT